MCENRMKKYLLFAMLIIFAPVVLGFGLSSDYLQDNTLSLAPGANYEYRINIQNPIDQPLFVNMILKDVGGIASFNRTSTVFEIPAKSYDTQIPLYISVPWYASEGTTYDISYTATPVEGPNGGIGFMVTLSRAFSVKISKDGFISRGTRAEKKGISEITANSVQTVYAHKFQIGSAFLILIAVLITASLLWRRSEIISNKILSQQKSSGTYSTLEEFYDLMRNSDDKTFWNYASFYEKDLRAWFTKMGSKEFARQVMASKTQKEFLQRLKNEIQKN